MMNEKLRGKLKRRECYKSGGWGRKVGTDEDTEENEGEQTNFMYMNSNKQQKI